MKTKNSPPEPSIERYGCSDRNCFFKDNKGQVTNGGCHCLDDLISYDRGLYRSIRSRQQNLKGTVKDLLDGYKELLGITKFAMLQASRDGGEFDIDEIVKEAKEIIKKVNAVDDRLIDAAPDLLKVCKNIYDAWKEHGFHESRSDFDEFGKLLEEVISKAEGSREK